MIECENCPALTAIQHFFEKFNDQLDELIKIEKQKHAPAPKPKLSNFLDATALLEMPDHLRKTAMPLIKLGRATAEDITANTHRARAVESAYLNQLVLMGYLKKERKGRKAYFSIEVQQHENTA